MSSVIPVPTLSTDGWVKTTSGRCDALFSDFLVAAHSQYPQEKIEASLPWLITRYQDDPRSLEDAIRRVLKLYFERTFIKADVECNVRENEQNPTHLDLYIRVTVTDEVGLAFTLGKIATVGERRVLKVAAENNGSLPTQA